jgi:hypothetical protein
VIQSSPVIVRLIEPKRDPTGLAHVFLDALGLTGVIVAAALVAAVIFGVVLFWLRSRSRSG